MYTALSAPPGEYQHARRCSRRHTTSIGNAAVTAITYGSDSDYAILSAVGKLRSSA